MGRSKVKRYCIQRWTGNNWMTIYDELAGRDEMTTSSIQYARGFADALKRFSGKRVRILVLEGCRYMPVEVRE
jgi:hypothetical protein